MVVQDMYMDGGGTYLGVRKIPLFIQDFQVPNADTDAAHILLLI